MEAMKGNEHLEQLTRADQLKTQIEDLMTQQGSSVVIDNQIKALKEEYAQLTLTLGNEPSHEEGKTNEEMVTEEDLPLAA